MQPKIFNQAWKGVFTMKIHMQICRLNGLLNTASRVLGANQSACCAVNVISVFKPYNLKRHHQTFGFRAQFNE